MEDKNLSTDRKSQQHLQEGYLSDSIVNDLAEFHAMDRALHHFGLNDSEKMIIYEIVAAILHLGNIQFEESPNDSHGGCRIIENDQQQTVDPFGSTLSNSLNFEHITGRNILNNHEVNSIMTIIMATIVPLLIMPLWPFGFGDSY